MTSAISSTCNVIILRLNSVPGLVKLFFTFTMPYDNVYGFEQNLRIENAASPPHTTLKLCWRSVAKDSVLMCADQRTQ